VNVITPGGSSGTPKAHVNPPCAEVGTFEHAVPDPPPGSVHVSWTSAAEANPVPTKLSSELTGPVGTGPTDNAAPSEKEAVAVSPRASAAMRLYDPAGVPGTVQVHEKVPPTHAPEELLFVAPEQTEPRLEEMLMFEWTAKPVAVIVTTEPTLKPDAGATWRRGATVTNVAAVLPAVSVAVNR
jgi:hypothetical protein